MTSWNTHKLRDGARHLAQSIDPITGTTTNDLVEVIDLDVRQMHETVFTITNTGSNVLFYSIKVRNEYSSGEEFEPFFNKISSLDSDEVILACHARIYILIKSQTSDTHTQYKIECIGER
jgi:hypothetical protein